MAPRRDDRCGARSRRAHPEPEPAVPNSQDLGLTSLGQALIDALREDERFREVIANPFEVTGPPPPGAGAGA